MSAPFGLLTEKEERALRQHELLNAIRRESKLSLLWFGLPWSLAGGLGFGIAYLGYKDSFAQGPHYAFFLMLMFGFVVVTCGIVRLLVLPLQHRLDALAKLIEEEIHKRR
jgi:hypothetical protein